MTRTFRSTAHALRFGRPATRSVNPAGAALAVLRIALIAFVLGLVALLVGPAVARVAGYEILAVRSGSMAPAIPAGAAVVAARTGADTIAVDDVVSIRMPNGIVVTHRVTRITDAAGERFFETKGDANADVDPSTVPASWVIGRVEFAIPLVGWGLALVALSSGVAVALSVGCMLLTALWLVEELGDDGDEDRGQPERTRPRAWLSLVPRPANGIGDEPRSDAR